MNQYQQTKVPDDVINMGVGYLSQDNFPVKDLAISTLKYCEENKDNGLYQYGFTSGYHDFRKKLANMMHRQTGREVNPNNLFVTNGVSHGLNLACQVFTKPGDLVFCEDLTYFIGLKILKENHLNLKSIVMNQNGIDIDQIQKEIDNGNVPKAVYIIPFSNNPTGTSYSEETKTKLIELSNKYNFKIFSDDVYEYLHFNDIQKQEYKSMHSYKNNNIISISSFSKIVCPALRLGWIEASEANVAKLKDNAVIVSGGGVNPLMCKQMEYYLDNFFEKNLESLKQKLSARKNIMLEAIDDFIAKDHYQEVTIPNGGFFIWIKFNDVYEFITSDDFVKFCEEKHKIRFQLGYRFNVDEKYKNCVRLCFAFYEDTVLTEGVKRFGECIDHYLKNYITKPKYQEIKVENPLNDRDNYFEIIDRVCSEKSNKISVAVQGATGRLGKLIMNEQSNFPNLTLKQLDRNYSNLNPNDVIIDVSSVEGLTNLLNHLIKNDYKNKLITGTTGDLPVKLLESYAETAPVVVSSNFSRGITMVKEIASIVNKYDDFKVDIVELHHDKKKDNPSGTALTLKNTFKNTDTVTGIRAGTNYGEHKIILNAPGEKIEIVHHCLDRSIFARGALKLVNETNDMKKINDMKKGLINQ